MVVGKVSRSAEPTQPSEALAVASATTAQGTTVAAAAAAGASAATAVPAVKEGNNNNGAAAAATVAAMTAASTQKSVKASKATSVSRTDSQADDAKSKRDEDGKSTRSNIATTSPLSFPAEVIAEAAKGVKPDNIENDFFDPSFYKNQVAMRQHDPEKRPKPAKREVIHDPNGGDEANLIRVIAKEVNPTGDKLCYITVKQATFLGAGAFSDVFLGYVSKTPRHNSKEQKDPVAVAIKKIWPDPSREDRQIGVHRCLDHINLVKLRYYYVCVHPRTKVTMWTLIMDLMPSTVAHEQSRYIDKGKIMPFLFVKMFTYQTFAGLQYMERMNYFHRDVKPENLLVCMLTGKLKIGDFGSAKHYKQGNRLSSYQVTRYYRAPELCLRYNYYDPTVDVWAAGCILAELVTNRIIFYGSNNRDQLFKILRICGTPTLAQLAQCCPGMPIEDEITATAYPPADWLKIVRRYNRGFNSVGADFLHKVLRYERSLRLRGDEALRHPFFDSLRNPSGRMPSGHPFPPLIGINC
uniref:Protein kinase domain-containing protein n=1 Tax=Panagrellus redivivus TaxID=6233 RepID=A0A7E4V4R3_PANRE